MRKFTIKEIYEIAKKYDMEDSVVIIPTEEDEYGNNTVERILLRKEKDGRKYIVLSDYCCCSNSEKDVDYLETNDTNLGDFINGN